jgi:phosphatidylglycerophosphate synthase
VFDDQLREIKERVLRPVAAKVWVPSAFATSAIGLSFGIGAALAAANGWIAVSLALWLLNRLCDGLDGDIARLRGTASPLGGYLDLLFDVIVYSAVPMGIAWHVGTKAVWIACAVMLASFYVNTLSWNLLSALMTSRGELANRTTVIIPRGFIEGAETIVAYCLFLMIPARSNVSFLVFAGLVSATVAQRTRWVAQLSSKGSLK